MESTNLEMRLATKQDFDTLTSICRLCFPEMLRWRAPKSHSRKWWRQLLDAEYCEIWLSLSNEDVIGFIELDLDKTESLYREDWEKHRPGLLVTFYMFTVCPKIFTRKALQKLKQRSVNNRPKCEGSPLNVGKIPAHEQLSIPAESTVCWIRRAAVIPSMQGKGVATEMYKFCFKKAIEFDYNEIRLMVERHNFKSLGMVKKLGFEINKEGDDALFYRKVLKAE